MAEEQPSLHIDTDWKRQAQEEKKRLAEQQQRDREQREQRAQPSPAAIAGAPAVPPGLDPAAGVAGVAAPAAGPARGEARGRRELPPASIATLVQSLTTQALLYLGEIPTSSGPVVNLDMAKHQIDTLTVLEDKTKNNLTEDEQKVMDLALYRLRTRFVDVASEFL